MDTAIYKANEKMEFLANDKEVLRLYHLREILDSRKRDEVKLSTA